ncbi:hypothetical protein BGZ95_006101 [Linnemannia exigua]|uniref:Uncharacterized protein n=1 Tax=Linnemannia exigua TaxID=604196 RepID=A0AAD4DGN1_9FUNG|nr:hypothetical protein BGZ95_006101 [Linnemannia exigua]
MQRTILSTSTTDQAGGPYQDTAESLATNPSGQSSEHHASTLAEEVEGAAPAHPLVQQQHKTTSGLKPLTAPQALVAPTNPEAAPKSDNNHKTITEEFVEMKHNLMDVLQSMERLGIALVEANQLSAQEASVESVKRSIDDLLHTNRDRPMRGSARTKGSKFGGRKFPRTYPPRKTWSTKLIEPYNLKPVASLDMVGLKEATLKAMESDGLTLLNPGYIAKSIIGPIVNGDDATLQLRGNKLQNFAFYAIVDVLDNASPEAQVVILVNRTTVKSSQLLVDSLKEHLDHAELNVDVHVVPDDRNVDLQPLTKSTPNKPCIFVSAPSTFARLKEAGVIRPKDVHVLVVFEAEYILLSNNNIEKIRTALADFEVCQIILACQHGTVDVAKAEEQFNFTEDRIAFSEDYVHIKSADHKYFVGNTILGDILKYAAGLGKTQTVVIVCHDGHEAMKLREQLKDNVELLVTSRAADAKIQVGGVVGGMLVTTISSGLVLEGTPHTPVRLILNLAGTTMTVDGYLRMMGAYMDISEDCVILSKVGSPAALKELEEFGVEFEAISEAAQL